MDQPSPHPAIRVFFALWPTSAECARLAGWQVPLRQQCGGRAMHSDTLHSTLVFIGDVEQTRRAALLSAAAEVRAEGFEVCFDEARYWAHNHIVYASPSRSPPQLTALVDTLKLKLAMQHFAFEQRAYQPHVTLLRNARWTDAPLPAMQPVCWQAKDFVLVQSLRVAGRASYRTLARFPLGIG